MDQTRRAAECQQPGPEALVQVGGSADQQHDSCGVNQAAAPVKRFALGFGPFAAQFGTGDGEGDQTERNGEVEDGAPAESVDQGTSEKGSARDAGIDAGDGDAEGFAALFGRKDRNDDGKGGCHDHGTAHALQEAHDDHRFNRPGLGEQAAGEGEKNDTVLEDAATAVDITHSAHGQQEDRGGEDVGGFHQPQLHGAGMQSHGRWQAGRRRPPTS